MFSSTSREHCQSKYYKEWHPDYIAAYNSLQDPNLKHFFKNPQRKTQMVRSKLMTQDGKAVDEKEWRRQNLEWERRRREADKDAEFRHQREVDKRRARMCLRQQQREDDYRKKKAEKQHDASMAVKEAWGNQEKLFSKITASNKRDIEHLLNFLNFEIKYILRPRSAPSMTKYRGTTRKLYTDIRAQRRSRSNRRVASAAAASSIQNGYSQPATLRPKSLEIEHRMTSPEDTVFGSGPDDQVSRGRAEIRNIEVPEREFSRSSQSVSPVRPVTAPARARRNVRPRSPSHPNYKEEAYLQSTVVLRYVGHTDHYTRLESRARHRAHRKSQRLPPLPAHVDEVTIEQQPRGSYVLEVFHGYLAVGDEFRFTSRRCDGYPFSLTIYVNRQCHVRLSTCCEAKRVVGSRLGQGCFQLLHVQNARPCIRCVLERDPIAQKHLAKIQTMRGTYDSMGNRLPPDVGSQQPARRSKSSSNLVQVKTVADYDPITDDFMHPSAATQESLLVPPDQQTRKSYAKSEKKHKMRPKSAPKHRVSHATSASKFDYPSNEDEGVEDFSEEELRLPDDDGSSAVSDQEYNHQVKTSKTKETSKDDRTKPPANNPAAEKVSPSVQRTKQKVEIKNALEENRAEGAEIAKKLIDADKNMDSYEDDAEIPSRESTESEEDTVDEAPSIVDEAMSKDATSSSGTAATCSVSDPKQKGPQKEASKAKEVVKPEPIPASSATTLKSGKKVSNFKALALLGKLFLGKPLPKESSSEESSSGSSYTGSSSEESSSEEESSVAQRKGSEKTKTEKSNKNHPDNEQSIKEDIKKDEEQSIKESQKTESVKEDIKSESKHKDDEPELPSKLPEEKKTEQTDKKTDDNGDFWDTEVPDNEKTVDKAAPTTTTKEPSKSNDGSPNDQKSNGSPPANGNSKNSSSNASRQSSAAGSRQSSPGTKRKSPKGSPKGSPKSPRKKAISSSTIGSTEGSMSTDASTSATPSGSLFVPKDNSDAKAKNTMNFKTFIMLKRMLKARRPPTRIPQSPPASPGLKNTDPSAEIIKVEVDVHHPADADPVKKTVTIVRDPNFPLTSEEEERLENGGSPKLHKRWDTEDNPTITLTSSDGVTEEITEIPDFVPMSEDDEEDDEDEYDEDDDDEEYYDEDEEDEEEESEEETEGEVDEADEEQDDTMIPAPSTNLDVGMLGISDDPELAAIKIQCGFRGHMARKQTKKLRKDKEENAAAAKIQAGFRGNKARKEVKKKKEEEDKAAAKIQAGFRGNKARKEVKQKKQRNEEEQAATKIQAGFRGTKARKEVKKKKEEEEQAAVKIQAGFKGAKARKEVKAKRLSQQSGSPTEMPAEHANSNTNTADEEKAATQIQAGFRGTQARKQVKQMKQSIIDEKEEVAATKIQAGFRGTQARKQVKEMRDSIVEGSNPNQGDVDANNLPEPGEDEEFDIDLNDPECDKAALKLQSGFRGHQARKEVKAMKEKTAEESKPEEEVIDIDLNDPENDAAALKLQAGFRGHQARKEVKAMKEGQKPEEASNDVVEEEFDIDLNDPECDKAALKLQSGFRGHQARKEVKAMKEGQNNGEASTPENDGAEEEFDIDLNDPECDKAALKLQSGFRGHQARKEVKAMKEGQKNEETNNDPEQEEFDIDLNDPECDKAALKLQSGFRGHQARKEVKAMKEGQNNDENGKPENKETAEEEFDIDLNDPECDKAALKLQSGFRGHQARKEVKAMKEGQNNGDANTTEINGAAEEEFDIDLNDPECDKAALKLQSGFRGHQARKEVKAMKEGQNNGDASKPENNGAAEEEFDIDLNDPECDKAALKLQSGFRGHQARKEVKAMKEEQNNGDASKAENNGAPEEEFDIDLNDPECDKAALKLQSGFRGHQARKEVKAMKEGQNNGDTSKPENNGAAEEEFDIDLNDPECDKAALKLQSGFRGHQARKEVKAMKEGQNNGDASKPENNGETEEEFDIDLNDPECDKAALKLQSGFRGHQARKEVKAMKEGQNNGDANKPENNGAEEEEFDIDLNDPECDKAALKLQSGFRGHQARKEVKAMKEGQNNGDASKPENNGAAEEEFDIDLNDPECDKAALKLQSGFRGHQARKEVKAMKEGQNNAESKPEDNGEAEEEFDIDLEDPECDAAALKLQAGFRGHQARKEVKAMKETKESEPEEEIIDIDLDDPECDAAALKLQAGFRGHQARKEVKAMKETKEETNAATVIQAGLRGYKVRKSIKSMRESIVEGNHLKNEVADVEEGEEDVFGDGDMDEQAKAATKIQAGFRGQKARTQVKEMRDSLTMGEHIPGEVVNKGKGEIPDDYNKANLESECQEAKKKQIKSVRMAMDENGNDISDDYKSFIKGNMDELNKAAKKVQRSYRLRLFKKDMIKSIMTIIAEEEKDLLMENNETDDYTGNVEANQAATKIQAGFRGIQARKQVQEMKSNQVPKSEEVTINQESFDDYTDSSVSVSEVSANAPIRNKKKPFTVIKRLLNQKDKEEVKKKTPTISTSTAASSFSGSTCSSTTATHTSTSQETTRKGPNLKTIFMLKRLFKQKQARAKMVALTAFKVAPKNTSEVSDDYKSFVQANLSETTLAASKIQASYRARLAQKHTMTSLRAFVEAEKAKRYVTDDYKRFIEANSDKMHGAASKIQAGYRHRLARRHMLKMLRSYIEHEKKASESGAEGLISDDYKAFINANVLKLMEAAITIQRRYRLRIFWKGVQASLEQKKTSGRGVSDDYKAFIDANVLKLMEAAITIQRRYRLRIFWKGIQATLEQKKTCGVTDDYKAFIDANVLKLMEAAITIQRRYRLRLFWKGIQATLEQKTKSSGEISDDYKIFIEANLDKMHAAATKIQKGYRHRLARKFMLTKIRSLIEVDRQTKQSHDYKSCLNGDIERDVFADTTDEANAATKIQAGFRGTQARKRVKIMKEEKGKIEEKDEEMFVDANDEDANQAATKIQAGFRGQKARNQVKEIRASIVEQGEKLADDFEVDAEDPEANVAATKIQAGFRGQKARKQVEEMKKDQQQGNNNEEQQSNTETSEYSPGYFELHGIESEQEDNTLSLMKNQDLEQENSKKPELLQLKESEKNDSVTSIKGSVESHSDDENTIKENMSQQQSIKPDKPADDVEETIDLEQVPNQEEEDMDPFDDLMDDYTDSSVSVSEPSANAPIRNKKMPFTVIKRLLGFVNSVKANKVGVGGSEEEVSEGSSKSSKKKGGKGSKVQPL